MCSRVEYVMTEQVRSALLQVLRSLPWLEKGRRDVRPTDQIQLIRPGDGSHELVSAHWGFMPAGMGAANLKKYAMFNTYVETLIESRAFGSIFQMQRCWSTVSSEEASNGEFQVAGATPC